MRQLSADKLIGGRPQYMLSLGRHSFIVKLYVNHHTVIQRLSRCFVLNAELFAIIIITCIIIYSVAWSWLLRYLLP